MTREFEKTARDWLEDALGSGHPVRKLVEHLDKELKEVTLIANQNAESCKGLSEGIDRLIASYNIKNGGERNE